MPRNAGGGEDGEQSVVLVDGFLLAELLDGGREVKGRIDIASDRSMMARVCCCWLYDICDFLTLTRGYLPDNMCCCII